MADGDVQTRITPPAKYTYQPSLDGLRAPALLAIIAYHFNSPWAQGAYLSVDLFFMLSGFLITTLLVIEWRHSDTIALRKFWGRRARRLLPALLLLLVCVAVRTRVVIDPWSRVGVRGDAIASLFYAANWHFIAVKQDYFELFDAAAPLRHMWALAIEEQSYLAWPPIVFVALRLARGSLRALGTPAGDAEMLERMDATLARVTRFGAKVLVVTDAPPAPNDAEGTTTSDGAVDDASYARLVSINRRFAALHRDSVTLVDLTPRLCPEGTPCPEFVDGIRMRPDGRHFTATAATIQADWLLPLIAALAN